MVEAISIRLNRRRARLAPRSVFVHMRNSIGRLSQRRESVFTLLGYRLYWCLRAPFARQVSGAGILVIGGAARSGTALLQTMLGRHPLIAAGPETSVFLRRIASPADIGARLGIPAANIMAWQRQSRSQAEFVDRVREAILVRSGGATLWAEKTPANVRYFRFIRKRFPEAHLAHVIRDGRDGVCSLRERSFAKLDGTPPLTVEAARMLALQWKDDVEAGLRCRPDPLYMEVRYEDLVSRPEAELRRLLDFVGLPWDDAVIDPETPSYATAWIDTHASWTDNLRANFRTDAERASGLVFASSVGRWRDDLDPEHQAALDPLLRPLLTRLGYR